MQTIADLIARHAGAGRVTWIGLRPERRAPMRAVDAALAGPEALDGDHASGGKRGVTLVQAEHLAVIGAYLGRGPVAAGDLRRNVVVEGINLLALRHRRVRIGDAVLEVTGPCAPCSRMEEALGFGGYSAVRGHGGVTARIVTPGRFAVGDDVSAVER